MLENIFQVSRLPTWYKPKASVDNKSWQTIKVLLLFKILIVAVTQAVIHFQFIDWIKSFVILKEFEEAFTKKKLPKICIDLKNTCKEVFLIQQNSRFQLF